MNHGLKLLAACCTLAPTFLASSVAAEAINVRIQLPEGAHFVKWSIESDRNDRIETFSDPSPHAPSLFSYPPKPENVEIWFPIIDIEWESRFEAVARFSDFEEGDISCWNGNFFERCEALSEELRFAEQLESWENQLFVQSGSAKLDSFSIETRAEPVNETQRAATLSFQTLSRNWSGELHCWIRQDAEGRWELLETFAVNVEKEPDPQLPEIDSTHPIESLKSTVRYLLESQNRNPLSPSYGGFFLFYDKGAQTHRRSDWMWSYGPAIQVLVRAAEIEAIAAEFGYERLMEAARLAAECSLRFQIDEADHPADGLVICRFDPRYDSPRGSEGFCSPADSLFLAGFGWIPYYEATGDERFLKASQRLCENVDRILNLDALIEQDYLLKEQRWKNWTMDESGFGMIGFSGIYGATSDPYYQGVGKRYLDGLLEVLEREDGLWDRVWHRNLADHSDNGWPVNLPRGEAKLIKTKFSTRGLGWAMIGLVSSCKLFPEDDRYLEKAIALSNHLLESQKEDGHWDFLFRDPQYEKEESAKGTALWTLLFYQLYGYTKDSRHLAAARSGLAWCIQNRYLEDDEGFGGLFDINRESGVVYRRWNELSCNYTMGFFGLALLEELALAENAEQAE